MDWEEKPNIHIMYAIHINHIDHHNHNDVDSKESKKQIGRAYFNV